MTFFVCFYTIFIDKQVFPIISRRYSATPAAGGSCFPSVRVLLFSCLIGRCCKKRIASLPFRGGINIAAPLEYEG